MDDILIDKAELLQEAVGQVEEALRCLGSGYATARQATLDSPHVMKSKREVTGIEASYLANGLARTIQERESWLQTLRAFRMPEKPGRAALGCVVGIGPVKGPVERLYFILPVCGGMEIPMPEGTRAVRIITPGTPVAKALIGKSLREEIEFRTDSEQPCCIQLLV
jgi:hypothetical protein